MFLNKDFDIGKLLASEVTIFPEKTIAVRGSDYSPAIALSEVKDKLV